ncbi:hypothetical protein F5Y03DRAFT_355234 [Xylaria venustula]|nr:hypothetical protein F5Y03DRAFT_355234 [Xylaria venustula]
MYVRLVRCFGRASLASCFKAPLVNFIDLWVLRLRRAGPERAVAQSLVGFFLRPGGYRGGGWTPKRWLSDRCAMACATKYPGRGRGTQTANTSPFCFTWERTGNRHGQRLDAELVRYSTRRIGFAGPIAAGLDLAAFSFSRLSGYGRSRSSSGTVQTPCYQVSRNLSRCTLAQKPTYRYLASRNPLLRQITLGRARYGSITSYCTLLALELVFHEVITVMVEGGDRKARWPQPVWPGGFLYVCIPTTEG